ncbi:MAG: tetratricopeptide repeat protein [Desulfuromonadales bacterium]|nr:tetratricopeptide repeat protein [Desulfuromonadales bacterium]MDT8422639.1 tetratricopeptide repeat protein [Desulfuromonadales bacterium]
MELAKLKKKLLQEELRRQNKISLRRKLAYAVLLFIAVGGTALGWYYYNLDSILAGRFATAEKLLKEQQPQQAAERFAALQHNFPSAAIAPEALFRLAEIQELYQRSYREAILTCTLVERDYPDHPLALVARERVARIYKERLHDNERAITVYQELVDAGVPHSDRLIYEIADAYFRENNFEQARIEFEGLIKNYPQSTLVPEASYRIGVAYALEHQSQAAELAYRQVVEVFPNDPFAREAQLGLAGVMEDQERLREALTVLEGLVGVYPNQNVLQKRIEQVRERINKKQKAI